MDDFLGANAMEPPTERMDQQEPQNASTDHPGPSTARADQPGPSNADVPGTSANAYKKHKKNKKRDPQALAQVPDEEAVDFEEQMHRRETVFQITQQFGETVQKMQKGVEEEMTSEEVVASIEQVDISQLASSKELTADLNMVHKAAQILAGKSTELRGAQRVRLNTELFGMRVKAYANNLDLNADPFVVIGKKFKSLLREPPAFDFMRANFAVQHGTDFKEKKERVAGARQQRNKDEVLELKGRTAQQAVEGQEDNTVTKHLDHIRKCLRNVLKQRNSQSIGYYDFILHPTSLSESVENAFHMCFLLKDGYVRLKIDEVSGCMPILELVSKQDRQHFQQNDRSQIATAQHISRLSQDMWEALVELLHIREPLITPITA